MTANAGYVGYQLRELQKNHSLGSLFTDPDNPDDFIAGYVAAVTAKTVFVESVTPYGRWDGWFGVRVSAIMEAMCDAVYAERLELLLKLNGSSIPSIDIPLDDDHVYALLCYARDVHRAVTVWTASETYAGFVDEVNDLFAIVAPVDFMGERCPPMTFRLPDIEMISVGSEEERMYEQLDDYHHAHLQ